LVNHQPDINEPLNLCLATCDITPLGEVMAAGTIFTLLYADSYLAEPKSQDPGGEHRCCSGRWIPRKGCV